MASTDGEPILAPSPPPPSGFTTTSCTLLERAAELQHQRDLALLLSSANELEPALLACAEAASDLSGLEAGGVYLLDEQGGIVLAASRGLDQAFRDAISQYPPGSPQAIFSHTDTPIYTSCRLLPHSSPPLAALADFQALAVLPFGHQGRQLGCLVLASPTLAEVPPARRLALEAIAAQIGGAVARLASEEALRQSERKYRLLTEHLSDVLFTCTLEGRLTYVSPAIEAVSGHEAAEAIGRNLVEYLARPEDVHQIAEQLTRLAQTGGPATMSVLVRPKTGLPLPVEITAITYREPNGELLVHGVLRDISSRVQAQEERRKLAERLDELQRIESIGRLAGTVAHDFNNLLAPILGNAELGLLETPAGSTLHELLQNILNVALRGRELTQQLLAAGRRQVLQVRPLDVNEVVQELSPLLRRVLGERSVVACDRAPGLGPVRADASQVHQILMNLLVNARDALPGGGKVRVTTREVQVDEALVRHHPELKLGPYISLAVTDDGSGMDAATLHRAFEPFFTTKGKEKGTGLGLATVLGLAQQHGGGVLAESAPGQGTRIEILLPRVAGKPCPTPRPARPHPASARPGECHVLLVEDDADVRQLTTQVLRQDGFRVIAAPDAEQALRLVQERSTPLHLLLTDVILPGRDGRDLHRLLLEQRPGLPALFMSGYPDEVIGERGVLEPGVHFLQKPFNIDTLRKMIDEVLTLSAE